MNLLKVELDTGKEVGRAMIYKSAPNEFYRYLAFYDGMIFVNCVEDDWGDETVGECFLRVFDADTLEQLYVTEFFGKGLLETPLICQDGFVATDGWLNVSRTQGVDFCRRVYEAGVRNVIYTDIARDGAMQGTNLSVYETLAREVPGLGVTASGGISSLSEIRALAAMGTKAAIVGKAVYTGALALPDMLAAAGEE